MKLLLKNKKYRLQVISRFISDIGECLFNIVFVVYAANVYKSELAVSIASVVALLPIFLELYTGILADGTKNKKKKIYAIGWIQATLFVIAYFLIGNNSILAFATLSLINITSDSVGLYLSNLEYTFFNKIVIKEDIREASLFNQVMYRLKSLIGPALGVWLLSISNNNYKLITLINAATFAIYAIMSYRIYRDLDSPKVAEKENFRTKIKEIFRNIVMVFEQDEDNKGMASKMIVTDSLMGGVSTAINNMVMVSFVLNPMFSLSFEHLTLLSSILFTRTAIVSGMFANDIFSKMSLKKLFEISIYFSIISAVIFFINSDISRLIGYTFAASSFYVRIKTGPKRSAAIFEYVSEDRLASVTSAMQFVSMVSLPIITGLMLTLYNLNKNIAWTLSIIILVGNLLWLGKRKKEL
ncbi:MFS transporter [Helcococcus kunzii]|uniref:MFS transporter n=1 Tax=Helcococcus kunzii TaxID=40091 RepID=UPI0021A94DDF|nr:MFS transporter [Helcococcus kunzii]MCT1795948.1 MFS transporter [Helcococcus kunzii]MCT1988276.1 MFS transporter [Helcococcus kunzii]